MLKLPAKVKVGAWEYAIESWSIPDAEDLGKWGDCSHSQRRIRISESCNRKQAAQTLLHEILHATVFVWGCAKDDSEERLVGALGEGLSAIWKDSPEVMRWIGAGLKR